MIAPTRGFAGRAARAQWRGFASGRASRPAIKAAAPKIPTKAPTKAPTRPPPNITRQYKPKPQAPPPTPPPPPPPPSETLDSIWRKQWIPLTGAALLAGALGFYIFGTVAASMKACPCSGPCEHSVPTGRPLSMTEDNAEQFDRELDLPEWYMGITKLRKRLAARATGDVLELAMGTGRNFQYYDWDELSAKLGSQKEKEKGREAHGVASFTGLDISVDMLDVARKRLVKTVPPMADSAPIVKASTMTDHTGGQLSFLRDHLRLINSDVHHKLPLTSTSDKYDTVIQTFGLCSVSDPVAVLKNLATVVKPESGRIILLEHGKGWFGVVNGLLDKNADKHFEKYGCWWNRDIEGIVEEAAQKTPGLEIVKVERPNILQMGTLVWVELKVTDKA